MLKHAFAALGLISGLAAATPSVANIVAPGQSASPDSLLVGSGATLVASTSGFFKALTFSGLYAESVFRDPSNTLPGCTGNCLDYDLTFVSNNPSSTDPIKRVTLGSFGGFVTDAGFDTSFSGSPAPTLVSRSSGNGDVIAWTFSATPLNPGTSAPPLSVLTNPTVFAPGLVSAQDLSMDTEPALGATVPEPATLAVLGMGLVGLGFLRRRRG